MWAYMSHVGMHVTCVQNMAALQVVLEGLYSYTLVVGLGYTTVN